MRPPKKPLFSVGIEDCRVDTFSVGGNGGSGKDTSNTGVHITHIASGAVGKSTESRSQLVNKRTAFHRMGESKEFRVWARTHAMRLAGMPPVDEQVDEAMRPEHIKVEVMGEKGWEPSEF